MKHLHVIPVPETLTPQEAWSEILSRGRLTTPGKIAEWAGVACNGEECAGVERA